MSTLNFDSQILLCSSNDLYQGKNPDYKLCVNKEERKNDLGEETGLGGGIFKCDPRQDLLERARSPGLSHNISLGLSVP